MKTYAILKRVLDRNDYEDIKWQAKTRRATLKNLATKCGCTYKQFYSYFRGNRDSTKVAETLLALGYELKEVR